MSSQRVKSEEEKSKITINNGSFEERRGEKESASKRDRTSDLSVNSRMLYLLSYGSGYLGS
jgi:hypothetical protein